MTGPTRRGAWVRDHRVLLGLLVLPTVIGALIVWSLGDRSEKVDAVPAAVVNLDKPVLEKGEDPIAAGRLLAAGLTSPEDDAAVPFDWQLTDADDARKGLESGAYHAVLTVPEDFSRTLARALEGKQPRRATIEVSSTDVSAAIVGRISEQVTEVSAERLGERVTATYLDTVFSETDAMAEHLGEAADGAGRLAQGTEQLGAGTTELATGLGTLESGAGELAGGAGELADGADELADGVDRLAQGTSELAGGLDTLRRRTADLPAQTDRLADGAEQVADGVEPYADILVGWADMCADPLVAARAARLCVYTREAVGADDANARRLKQGSRQLAAGARELADAAPRLTGGIGEAADGAGKLTDGAREAAGGARQLADGGEQLAVGAGRLSGGAGEAARGARTISSGSEDLGEGSQKLASGLQQGIERIPRYDEHERGRLADVIAQPVAAEADSVGDGVDGRDQVAPAVLAVVLWLGAFATYLVRPALPPHLLMRPGSAGGLAWRGLAPGLALGAAQALLVGLVLRLLGVDAISPVATVVLMLLGAVSFAAVNQAVVALLGRRRGWLVAIAFTGLQVAALGGFVPVESAPWPLRLLNALVPVASLADGLGATALGGPGPVAATVAVLLVWGVVAFVLTLQAARKAQQVDVRQLVEVEPSRGRSPI